MQSFNRSLPILVFLLAVGIGLCGNIRGQGFGVSLQANLMPAAGEWEESASRGRKMCNRRWH